MPKKKLFEEDSDESVELKTENEYAKKYDMWREKEEMHKLEQKYGDKALSSDVSVSSDSEDESDEPVEVSEEAETQFLKTLALLKTKDPRIYDPSFNCFEDTAVKNEEVKPKVKTVTFEDSDSDDDNGDIFTIEKKAQVDEVSNKHEQASQERKPKAKLAEYLTGQSDPVDQSVDPDLAPLKALWSDPHISEGEAFLRDYILNQRYLERDDPGEAANRLRDDEALEEDERRVEEQGLFERAYNFRFEEPDHEFLKRYPRTLNSVRPKDDSRARHRAEVRTRKAEDKQRRMDEIARLKALKLKEIQEKIAKIKEVTGNQDLAFKEADIEGDFDPLEHDRRMAAIFDDQYYTEADGEKPQFPELDDELEIENWDNYDPEVDRQEANNGEGPHCEDDDFNMDADYDPKLSRANLLEEIQKTLGKKRRNRKKKSKLAQLLSSEKPKFVPIAADKSYAEYMEEYYKMDCEDIIGGDLPTRFKYREVVPNDYGLTVEEILLADDKELTQWVPLKKIVRHRPAAVEKGEVATYSQKAQDQRLMQRVLPSLFKELPEEPELVVPLEETTRKKKKKKKNKNKDSDRHKSEERTEGDSHIKTDLNGDLEENIETTKKTNKHEDTLKSNVESGNSTDILESTKKKKDPKVEYTCIEQNEMNQPVQKERKKKKNKLQKENNAIPSEEHTRKNIIEQNTNLVINGNTTENSRRKKKNMKKKMKMKKEGFVVENIHNEEPSRNASTSIINKSKDSKNLKRKLDPNTDHLVSKKKKKSFDNLKGSKTKFKQKDKFVKKQDKLESDNPLSKLSDERLKAYGLNPKKYRSFLKYKKF